MQVAITIPDDELDEIDRLVPDEFRSRAEVIRVAVAAWIRSRRAEDIDSRYRAAYDDHPQTVDDIDAGRLRRSEGHAWDDLEW